MGFKIQTENLSMVFGDKQSGFHALKDINLQIRQGEFVCVIGPSGCGKSTLLSILEGITPQTAGNVYIDGKAVDGPGKERAVVQQHYSLFPWMSAKKNIIFALRQISDTKDKQALEGTALQYLELVGLKGAEDKLPGELSGGMQQRVAIARALAVDPDILLMDEPFGAIDAKNRLLLQELLLKLWGEQEKKKTVVFVTHDIDEALLLADRILFMEPARIVEEIHVNAPRPREKSSFFSSAVYNNLHRKLFNLFYNDGADPQLEGAQL